MPTMIGNVRATGNINQDRRVVDMAKEIALLEPDAAPLTVLLKRAKGKTEQTINSTFKHLEDELNPRWDAFNYATGYAADATEMVVDNGSYFKANDVIKNTDTDEQMLVTGVSSNTLTVTRGYGSTTAAAVTDNDSILILGNAQTEGSTAPDEKTTQTETKTNYTEIIRTPFSVTGTQDASENYGGKDISYLQKKMGIEHLKTMELKFLFSEPKNDTSTNSAPRRTTGGLNYWISTNRTNANGTLTESEFETFCRTLFRYGTKKKVLMASPLLISAINSWGQAKLNMVPSDKTYGISLKEYLSGHGSLYLVKHDLLEEDYSGFGFAIDVDNIQYRPLRDRDTKLNTNIQANDSDTRKDEYFTEAGIAIKLEKAHSVLYGVTSYS